MPHPFRECFTALTKGKKRAILKNKEASNYLPEELVVENILTRLPARTLAVCCCICKSWYNAILNDSRFSVTHYIQNEHKFSLVFNVLNVSRAGISRSYTYSLSEGEKMDFRYLFGLDTKNIYETVGYCNGLICMKIVGARNYTRSLIVVTNPNRGESLVIPYLRPTDDYIYLGHGFGFDALSQVYKAVMVFTSEANNEFLCMVMTLGTMSWRKILTSTFDISPPPGSSYFPGGMVTRVSRTIHRQATFCGGDLFWRTENKVISNSNYFEMLLSFDLHNEKFRFIRLPTASPTACSWRIPTTGRQYLADDHLMEFKGYPCIAHSERITTRANNDHRGHRCKYRSGACCCCYKVHMYVLKDKDEQFWTREETFDVRMTDQGGLRPFCCYFSNSAVTPPTRMLTFSGQVLLYWFTGKRLIFYNLQEKHFKVVECFRSNPSVFQTKMNEDLERRIGDDNNIYCPAMDYQLHAQVDNMVSLKTFIPKEAITCKSDRADKRHQFDNDIAAGWLITGRIKCTYYVFS